MKIKIIFVIVFLAGLLIGSGISIPVTSKIKDKEFSRTEKVYTKTIDRYATAYETLANKARVTIQNKYEKVKNKKGNMYFVPASTIEIDRMIEDISQGVTTPRDSMIIEQIKPQTFWDKIKFW